MSPIGRIFTVLNLILAAAFLGWASNTLATSKQFKDKYETEKTAHDATRQEKDEEISTFNQAFDLASISMTSLFIGGKLESPEPENKEKPGEASKGSSKSG